VWLNWRWRRTGSKKNDLLEGGGGRGAEREERGREWKCFERAGSGLDNPLPLALLSLAPSPASHKSDFLSPCVLVGREITRNS
jgi:hypothetical protein